jgi:hypothetical protein
MRVNVLHAWKSWRPLEDIPRLGDRRFLIGHGPIVILAVLGFEVLAAGLGRWPRPWALAAGGGLALLSLYVGGTPQTQTRLLLSVVIGSCAGIAAELATRPRVRLWLLRLLLVTLAVSLGLTAIAPVGKFRILMKHDLAITVEARADLWRSWSLFYRAADEDLGLLDTGLPLGPLQVFGSPVLQLRANRPTRDPVPRSQARVLRRTSMEGTVRGFTVDVAAVHRRGSLPGVGHPKPISSDHRFSSG